MSDPAAAKLVVSLKFKDNEYDDTASTMDLLLCDKQTADNMAENRIAGDDRQGDISNHEAQAAQMGNCSGRITVELKPRPAQDKEKDDRDESREQINYPINTNIIHFAGVGRGTSSRKSNKSSNTARAPSTRKKRKPAENPRDYVPLAIREKKEDDYYWYNY